MVRIQDSVKQKRRNNMVRGAHPTSLRCQDIEKGVDENGFVAGEKCAWVDEESIVGDAGEDGRLVTAQEAREIVLRSVKLDSDNYRIARNYTFVERNETRQLDGQGRLKERRVLTHDVTLLEGLPYLRLIARNDQPLPPAEEKKEREKLRKSIAERQKEMGENIVEKCSDVRLFGGVLTQGLGGSRRVRGPVQIACSFGMRDQPFSQAPPASDHPPQRRRGSRLRRRWALRPRNAAADLAFDWTHDERTQGQSWPI